MSRRTAVLIALLGVAVLTSSTWKMRSIERRILGRVDAPDRFVDIGVVLHTVHADPSGEVLLEGKPPMRIVATNTFGYVLDTRTNPPRKHTETQRPVTWYASEDQAAAVLHDDPKLLGQLVYGSEGAGKTRTLAMWHYFRWLESIGQGREGGQTAPTETRLEFVREEMRQLYRPNWYHYVSSQDLFRMCDGSRIKLVSTYRQSKAQGSPIQGFNWSWCGRDEAQDQIEVHADIESRGRSARNGQYKQLATATAKDDTDWRNLRDQLLASGFWTKRQLLISRSPFVAPDFLSIKSASMSDREFRRRYGAEDLPPERATYPAWSREHNLITLPDLGWEDVTASELAPWGPHFGALVGHDPGSLFDVSVILKAYRINPRSRPVWVVVDEVTTEQSTTEEHVAELIGAVRQRWSLNLLDRRGSLTGLRMLVRADPYGNNDGRPDRSCYTIFRNAGITIHPAAYNAEGHKPGRVPKNEGIEVVNTLLCSARGERRLFVARKPDSTPAAPRLVKAIESSERDLLGKAETQRKDTQDQSHWPAALRYALWAIERPRLKAIAGGLT